jgi:group I intron endonuclease
MNSFIYLSINKINGKSYIGKHNSTTEKDMYFGSGLLILKAIKKYGKKNFIRIKIKNIAENVNHLMLEEYYIRLFDTLEPNGYNISPTGGLSICGQHSEKSKKKISESKRGIKFSEEHRKNLSKSHKDKPGWQAITNEIRKENGKKLKGKTTWMKGKKHTQETKQKISKSKKLNPVHTVHTPEGIEKIRIAMKNRIVSEETREKMSKSMKGRIPPNKGKKCSEETRKKMSIAKKEKYIGKDNPMYGKSLYDIWIKKYGLEETNKRKKALYEKRSLNRKFKNDK